MSAKSGEESQKHGFDFEDMVIEELYGENKYKEIFIALNLWKSHKKNYTSIFDLPDYDYLVGFFEKVADFKHNITFTREDYERPIKKIGLSLPISIKSYKKTNSEYKKIEFGDLERTVENVTFDNALTTFSIICIEWEQKDLEKEVAGIELFKVDKKSPFIQKLREGFEVFDIKEDLSFDIKSRIEKINEENQDSAKNQIKKAVKEVKTTPTGVVSNEVRRKLRSKMKTTLNKVGNIYKRKDKKLKTGLLKKGARLDFIEARVKMDSKNQRRVQCTLNKFLLKEYFKVNQDNKFLIKVTCKIKGKRIKSLQRKRKKCLNRKIK
jgi:hypothetical protein